MKDKTSAEEVMNRRVESIKPDASVLDAIERITTLRIRSLVVEPDEDGVYGVVTVRDIVFKCLAKRLDPKQVKIKDISTKPIICVEKNMPLEHVLNLMEKFNIARVFVKDRNKVVGVISLMDAMTAFLMHRVK
ncbi:MAG: histidine kinase [Candidatus Neomarinimicrobiota bacterium]|nr:MAG: histidine kinase [Candidatus Neomarinimicrobiota bacterium]